jgi:RNA-directed DNA polymerase
LNRVLDKIPVADYLWAFEKNKNVPQMSRAHIGKDVVISLDLEDYFNKVHVSHILPILDSYGISEMAGRVVAELCCYKFFLPQGGLTSPKLSNIVAAHTFGPRLKEYADSIGATLTIYADDVTLSFTGQRDVDSITKDVSTICKENGNFTINKSKTKVMTKKRRQYVCGVVVNEKPNLPKEERYRLRAIVHNIQSNGLKAEAEKNGLEESEFLASIKGRINWYGQLNPDKAKVLSDKLIACV